ncbi:MAG: hypothetical protein EBZ77_02295 [Chitinophagia bacterium]|nr:hypothetical protein [Chitinophagia bacterium]
MKYHFLLLFLVVSFSCKTAVKGLSAQQGDAAPNSCQIAGVILETPVADASNNMLIARIKITDAGSCGPGIVAPYHSGDTIQLQFMEYHKQKLKKGNIFTATCQQRLLPGNSVLHVAVSYTKH